MDNSGTVPLNDQPNAELSLDIAVLLDAIEGRLNAATPGDWFAVASRDGDDIAYNVEGVSRYRGFTNNISLGSDVNTAKFIAHSREDIRDLLATITNLNNKLADAEARATRAVLAPLIEANVNRDDRVALALVIADAKAEADSLFGPADEDFPTDKAGKKARNLGRKLHRILDTADIATRLAAHDEKIRGHQREADVTFIENVVERFRASRGDVS